MNLKAYLHSFPRSERIKARNRIANALGISEVYVRSMANGNKRIPAKYAIAIENITCGAVPRHITAPKFYPIENIYVNN